MRCQVQPFFYIQSFFSEHWGRRLFRNVSTYLTNYAASPHHLLCRKINQIGSDARPTVFRSHVNLHFREWNRNHYASKIILLGQEAIPQTVTSAGLALYPTPTVRHLSPEHACGSASGLSSCHKEGLPVGSCRIK